MPLTDLQMEACARAAHEANRAYCIAVGDDSQPTWDDAPDWQKSSALNGVAGAMAGATPEQSHESWMVQKTADGWKWGAVKDPDKKEHPAFKPYADLPPEQRAKDGIFVTVVRAMAAAFEGNIWAPANAPEQAQRTDLLRHPDTGHLVGIEQAPPAQPPITDYPKWVTPHASWVVRDQTGRATTPAFVQQHLDRSGGLTVMVESEEEEKRATSQMPDDKSAGAKATTEAVEAETIAAEEARIAEEERQSLAEQRERDEQKRLEDIARRKPAK